MRVCSVLTAEVNACMHTPMHTLMLRPALMMRHCSLLWESMVKPRVAVAAYALLALALLREFVQIAR